jgi:hypothetical protein
MTQTPSAGALSAQRTRLNLRRCFLSASGQVQLGPEQFSAMINPASFSLDRGIKYAEDTRLGQIGNEMRFAAVEPETVKFDLLLDGTGVVAPATPADAGKGVRAHLDDLVKVVYAYAGQRHEPGRVRILWGSFSFYGRLNTMNTQYTLFKPSGEPLRAKVALSFTRFMSAAESSLASNRSSPDLSHRVEVRAGDTLPLLCQRIYGDARHYLAVARFNGLADFRRLAPGRHLHFPPLA